MARPAPTIWIRPCFSSRANRLCNVRRLRDKPRPLRAFSISPIPHPSDRATSTVSIGDRSLSEIYFGIFLSRYKFARQNNLLFVASQAFMTYYLSRKHARSCERQKYQYKYLRLPDGMCNYLWFSLHSRYPHFSLSVGFVWLIYNRRS